MSNFDNGLISFSALIVSLLISSVTFNSDFRIYPHWYTSIRFWQDILYFFITIGFIAHKLKDNGKRKVIAIIVLVVAALLKIVSCVWIWPESAKDKQYIDETTSLISQIIFALFSAFFLIILVVTAIKLWANEKNPFVIVILLLLVYKFFDISLVYIVYFFKPSFLQEKFKNPDFYNMNHMSQLISWIAYMNLHCNNGKFKALSIVLLLLAGIFPFIYFGITKKINLNNFFRHLNASSTGILSSFCTIAVMSVAFQYDTKPPNNAGTVESQKTPNTGPLVSNNNNNVGTVESQKTSNTGSRTPNTDSAKKKDKVPSTTLSKNKYGELIKKWILSAQTTIQGEDTQTKELRQKMEMQIIESQLKKNVNQYIDYTNEFQQASELEPKGVSQLIAVFEKWQSPQIDNKRIIENTGKVKQMTKLLETKQNQPQAQDKFFNKKKTILQKNWATHSAAEENKKLEIAQQKQNQPTNTGEIYKFLWKEKSSEVKQNSQTTKTEKSIETHNTIIGTMQANSKNNLQYMFQNKLLKILEVEPPRIRSQTYEDSYIDEIVQQYTKLIEIEEEEKEQEEQEQEQEEEQQEQQEQEQEQQNIKDKSNLTTNLQSAVESIRKEIKTKNESAIEEKIQELNEESPNAVNQSDTEESSDVKEEESKKAIRCDLHQMLGKTNEKCIKCIIMDNLYQKRKDILDKNNNENEEKEEKEENEDKNNNDMLECPFCSAILFNKETTCGRCKQPSQPESWTCSVCNFKNVKAVDMVSAFHDVCMACSTFTETIVVQKTKEIEETTQIEYSLQWVTDGIYNETIIETKCLEMLPDYFAFCTAQTKNKIGRREDDHDYILEGCSSTFRMYIKNVMFRIKEFCLANFDQWYQNVLCFEKSCNLKIGNDGNLDVHDNSLILNWFFFILDCYWVNEEELSGRRINWDYAEWKNNRTVLFTLLFGNEDITFAEIADKIINKTTSREECRKCLNNVWLNTSTISDDQIGSFVKDRNLNEYFTETVIRKAVLDQITPMPDSIAHCFMDSMLNLGHISTMLWKILGRDEPVCKLKEFIIHGESIEFTDSVTMGNESDKSNVMSLRYVFSSRPDFFYSLVLAWFIMHIQPKNTEQPVDQWSTNLVELLSETSSRLKFLNQADEKEEDEAERKIKEQEKKERDEHCTYNPTKYQYKGGLGASTQKVDHKKFLKYRLKQILNNELEFTNNDDKEKKLKIIEQKLKEIRDEEKKAVKEPSETYTADTPLQFSMLEEPTYLHVDSSSISRLYVEPLEEQNEEKETKKHFMANCDISEVTNELENYFNEIKNDKRFIRPYAMNSTSKKNMMTAQNKVTKFILQNCQEDNFQILSKPRQIAVLLAFMRLYTKTMGSYSKIGSFKEKEKKLEYSQQRYLCGCGNFSNSMIVWKTRPEISSWEQLGKYFHGYGDGFYFEQYCTKQNWIQTYQLFCAKFFSILKNWENILRLKQKKEEEEENKKAQETMTALEIEMLADSIDRKNVFSPPIKNTEENDPYKTKIFAKIATEKNRYYQGKRDVRNLISIIDNITQQITLINKITGFFKVEYSHFFVGDQTHIAKKFQHFLLDYSNFFGNNSAQHIIHHTNIYYHTLRKYRKKLCMLSEKNTMDKIVSWLETGKNQNNWLDFFQNLQSGQNPLDVFIYGIQQIKKNFCPTSEDFEINSNIVEAYNKAYEENSKKPFKINDLVMYKNRQFIITGIENDHVYIVGEMCGRSQLEYVPKLTVERVFESITKPDAIFTRPIQQTDTSVGNSKSKKMSILQTTIQHKVTTRINYVINLIKPILLFTDNNHNNNDDDNEEYNCVIRCISTALENTAAKWNQQVNWSFADIECFIGNLIIFLRFLEHATLTKINQKVKELKIDLNNLNTTKIQKVEQKVLMENFGTLEMRQKIVKKFVTPSKQFFETSIVKNKIKEPINTLKKGLSDTKLFRVNTFRTLFIKLYELINNEKKILNKLRNVYEEKNDDDIGLAEKYFTRKSHAIKFSEESSTERQKQLRRLLNGNKFWLEIYELANTVYYCKSHKSLSYLYDGKKNNQNFQVIDIGLGDLTPHVIDDSLPITDNKIFYQYIKYIVKYAQNNILNTKKFRIWKEVQFETTYEKIRKHEMKIIINTSADITFVLEPQTNAVDIVDQNLNSILKDYIDKKDEDNIVNKDDSMIDQTDNDHVNIESYNYKSGQNDQYTLFLSFMGSEDNGDIIDKINEITKNDKSLVKILMKMDPLLVNTDGNSDIIPSDNAEMKKYKFGKFTCVHKLSTGCKRSNTQILREIKLYKKTNKKYNPFIIRCWAYKEDNSKDSLKSEMLLEWCENKSLLTLLNTQHPETNNYIYSDAMKTDIDTRLFVACNVFMAMDYLHKLGMAHLDIKTANILIDKNGWLKLCDFSMTIDYKKENFNEVSNAEHSNLSLSYSSPEMYYRRDRQIDFKSDYFSLGCVMLDLFNMDKNWLEVHNRHEYAGFYEFSYQMIVSEPNGVTAQSKPDVYLAGNAFDGLWMEYAKHHEDETTWDKNSEKQRFEIQQLRFLLSTTAEERLKFESEKLIECVGKKNLTFQGSSLLKVFMEKIASLSNN